MKIITDHTEENLISLLEYRCSTPDMGCCLQIKGTLFENDDFLSLPQWITGWVGDSHSEIYVCHDKDIFVFSPHMNHDSYLQFKNIFQERFALQKAAHSISYYQLDESGPALLEAGKAKLAKRKEIESRKKAEIAKVEKEDILRKFMKLNPTQEHTSSIRKRRRSRTQPQILVVEDDPFSRKLISSVLDKHYTVAFSEDAFSAIIDYLTLAPDIVFLDINLPDVSGHDVLIKIMSFDPEAFPVMLSGNCDTDNIRHAMAIGAKGFVGKPFCKEKLVHYIQKSLQEQVKRKAG